MRVLVAPDKFKGSLSAIEVARAIERGIMRSYPDAEVILTPLADGGEGTVEALVTATGGKIVGKRVTGPLGNPIDSHFGLLSAHGSRLTAHAGIVEMAAASGLHLVPQEKQNPLVTTTFGTGELIKAALHEGCDPVIVGIGGSATTDGGMGMAQALGVKFFDGQGQALGRGCGRLLVKVEVIDPGGLGEKAAETDFLVASDVRNPLTGPEGAAYVYAPQKGATAEMVKALDEGLNHYAEIIKKDLGIDIKDVPGSGAAGGLGAGLMVFLGAELKSGVDLVMEAVGFEDKLRGIDLVITGEGKIDAQTLYGKVPIGVAKMAQKKGIPVIAIAGQITAEPETLKDHAFTSFYSLVKPGVTPEQAMKNAAQLLEETTTAALKQ